MMMLAMVFLSLALPWLATWHASTRVLRDWRLGVAGAAIACSAWAIVWTELLSLPGAFTQPWLWLVWGVPALAGTVCLVRERAWRSATRGALDGWRALSQLERSGIVVIGACCALTLITALVAAPNNWDSMTYHLARVEAWRQLEAVSHYATHIEPQLYQPPGAEYFLAQPYLLSGGSDVLVALVQWLAYVEIIVVGSYAAALLGASRRTQVGAALLVATIPLAILQASSTQNDLVLASKLLIALTFALAAHPLAASLSIGIAVLVKGTGLLFAAPIGVLVLVTTLRAHGARRTLLLALAGIALVAAPNLGQWARNHDTYGTLVASEHAGIGNPYQVQDPGIGSLVSNLVRNATNHMDLPTDAASDAVERWTVRALDAVGIDASDPRTTFLGQPFRVGPFGPHEDHAGSLLLLVLGLWAAISTVRARDGRQLAWLAVVAAQVLLFAWLITWQNWHVRMHLPVTVGVAVLVAVRLGARRSARALVAACMIASLMAPLYLLFNVTRPLAGRDSILTHSRAHVRYLPRPQLRAPYEEVVRRVAAVDPGRVGLVTGIDDWQYPLQAAFARRGIDVEQVLVTGPSQRHATNGDLPDAVVCVNCQPAHHEQLVADGLTSVPLDARGARPGHGDDMVTVELWTR